MKGLLIKDFSLMRMQKNFFIIILGISAFMTVFKKDISFAMGFLPMVISLFTLSTISYDEFDNGNAFLFTLPITRKTYVMEKYCLGIILGCAAWATGILLGGITVLAVQEVSWKALFLVALSVFPLIFLLLAIMIPLQLKFGSEKGRLAMIVVIGIVTLLGILTKKAGESLGFQWTDIMKSLSATPVSFLIICGILLVLLLLGISLKISIKIMKKKEF